MYDPTPLGTKTVAVDDAHLQSPDYLRMSLAAAITLGIKPGIFYRDAQLYCINLLLTYPSGCSARCAYCGLSSRREGAYDKKSFIRVTWPKHPLDDIIRRISERTDRVKRICISQITNRRAIGDTVTICAQLRSSFDIPVSILVSPTILTKRTLCDLKDSGADKIGVAIDLATEPLFERYRGSGVNGPHSWDRYFACLDQALAIFGERNAGAHFVVGMGESEQEMVEAMQRVQNMGGWTHLFSFFPETDSQLHDREPPPMDQYRRIQIARFLIDKRMTESGRFSFSTDGKIEEFGITRERLDDIIDSGEPFRTSGCEGYDGEVACNRPYGNSRPGPNIRNFPFKPSTRDIARIRMQLYNTPEEDATGDA